MKTPKPSKDLIPFIWKLVQEQKWSFFFIGLLSLAWSLDATVGPYLLSQIIDTLTSHDEARSAAWPTLKWILLKWMCLWVFVEGGFRGRDFIKAATFPKLEAAIRMRFFDHIARHSPAYFNQQFPGALSNKINDMATQVSLLLHNVIFFIPTVGSCVLTLFFFFKLNGVFALFLSAWIILHLTICLLFTPKCIHYSNVHGEARSALAGKIVDSLSNNFSVNLFHRFSFEKQQILISQTDEKTKNSQASFCVAKMFLCLSTLYIIGGVLLLCLMIYYWMHDWISTGQVVQIFNTTWNLIFILWFAGEMLPQFFQSIGIASQALSVLRDPQDILDKPGATPLVVSSGEIEFDGVSFQYGEKLLFKNKRVKIRSGEKVGLVGFSGGGKSTFVKLILRLHALNSGRILIDGRDISNVTLQSLREQTSLIPQEPLLFHRTLMENIRYGRLSASDDEVKAAAKFAHCEEFISKQSQGYDTLVGDKGANLSGGERQRIAIARAFLAQTPILILDEATSALDSVTEQYIQESLEKLMENRTTIVIAHRLSTLAKMDRILVFDEGKIVEEGTHAELIAKNGVFAKMWKMQAGGFLP